MTNLFALRDRLADGTIARVAHPAVCDRCGRPIRGRADLAIRLHPSGGWERVERHERCPIRLTSRGRLARDIAVACLVGIGLAMGGMVVLAHWPALAALMRMP